ncbi:MAG: lipocalin family protein [Flavobacteriales bacterium]|nr:lipocalin family protein [Flavobacteriales bacterium]
MKRVALFLLVVMVSVGCATKIEKARKNIQGTWRIEAVVEDGQDVTAAYTATRVNYRISFDNDNGFVEVYQLSAGSDEVSIIGTWDFTNKAEQITLVDANQTRTFRVDKLDEDEFNVTDLGSSNDRMLRFVPN